MTARLLTIGRFAQLTGLTVRALRLYDELGVLQPEAVDGSSRYRYYAPSQLPRAVLVRRLRRLDLPLEQITRFLDAGQAERDEILAGHRVRLDERIAATYDAMHALDQLRGELETREARDLSAAQITPMQRKSVTDQPVLRIRWALPEEAGEEYPLTAYFAEIAAAAGRQGLTMAGAPYCVVYSDVGEDGMVRGEAGIPVDRPGMPDGQVEPSVLPGGENAITRYTGPVGASNGAAVVRALWSQIDAAGLTAHGDPRWTYLSKPDVPPAEQVTEVAWPVTPQPSRGA